MVATFGSPHRGEMEQRIQAAVVSTIMNQVRHEIGGMIETAVEPVRDSIRQVVYDRQQTQAQLEEAVSKIEKNTGTVLQKNPEKADEVLTDLKEQINVAGNIAVDGQKRVDELVGYINTKYASIEQDKTNLDTWGGRTDVEAGALVPGHQYPMSARVGRAQEAAQRGRRAVHQNRGRWRSRHGQRRLNLQVVNERLQG